MVNTAQRAAAQPCASPMATILDKVTQNFAKIQPDSPLIHICEWSLISFDVVPLNSTLRHIMVTSLAISTPYSNCNCRTSVATIWFLLNIIPNSLFSKISGRFSRTGHSYHKYIYLLIISVFDVGKHQRTTTLVALLPAFTM